MPKKQNSIKQKIKLLEINRCEKQRQKGQFTYRPRSNQPEDWSTLQSGDNGHDRMQIVQFKKTLTACNNINKHKITLRNEKTAKPLLYFHYTRNI